MKRQVVVIHGGGTFDTYEGYISFLKKWKIDFEEYRHRKKNWKENLGKALGKRFEVIAPRMPNSLNAKYREWKIWFDKFVPHLRTNAILVGHSLGGIFLAKYLSENEFPKKIKATFLVAVPYDDKNRDSSYSLADFKLPKSLNRFSGQAGKIFIYHSKDDPLVPFVDSEKYEKALKMVTRRTFAARGHFLQGRLPELIRDIKKSI